MSRATSTAFRDALPGDEARVVELLAAQFSDHTLSPSRETLAAGG